MKRSAVILAALLAAISLSGNVRSQAPTIHLGSAVVMQRYEMPELIGQKRAAIVAWGPFECPLGHPDPAEPCDAACRRRHPRPGETCVNLEWFVSDRGLDPENADPVLCAGEPCPWLREAGVKTGMDGRKNVPHDPTGTLPRSWHVWGEAAGEE